MNARLFGNVVLGACSAPVLACSAYLFTLTVLSRRDESAAPRASDPPGLRFAVVVPAHNEQENVAATVASLSALDYPADLRRIVVVADNCTDETADRARAAGATVFVRDDPSKRGKGYALTYAFDRLVAEGWCDVVVVVDADTEVSPNLLRAFAARFEAGASAAQARYGVRNRNASWRTRLMAIGFAMFHDVRSLGRERLRLSCGLRGNGMAFRRTLLRDVPHGAFSIVEDVEYGIELGRLGHRVWYVDEACVLGEMVATEKGSRSQRQRWEGGRFRLAREHARQLLTDAFRRRDPVLLDLAMDVLVPPLSYIALAAAGGAAVSAVAVTFRLASWPVLLPWCGSLVFLGAYVGRGVVLSGAGARGFVDLASAPVYIAWKLALAARGQKRKSDEWVRTARTGEKVS